MPRTLYVTETDRDILARLLSSRRRARFDVTFAGLSDELGRAVVVRPEAIPADVVTMNSVVRLTDLDTGRRGEYALVFPGSADFRLGRLSVLAPIGTALLGRRAGDVVEWVMPAGPKRYRIDAIVYQPEADGTCPPRHPVRAAA